MYLSLLDVGDDPGYPQQNDHTLSCFAFHTQVDFSQSVSHGSADNTHNNS